VICNLNDNLAIKQSMSLSFQEEILQGIPGELIEAPSFDPTFSRAPVRRQILLEDERELAIKNALRYFPKNLHSVLRTEFEAELRNYGRIYMYRYRPRHPIFARSISEYPAKCASAAAIMLMIQNNLDPRVAQHPYELVTYGGNGSVFQNWAQYRLVMQYLSQLTENETLSIYSGHPHGVFPSFPSSPRVIVTNGMVIPNYSKPDDLEKMSALGVTQYGQMTAGSFMYIGPQGIVHGTTLTLLNAARLKFPERQNLKGMLFVSSGLGGMSGAQAKAAVIAGAIGVIAEMNPLAAKKRHAQRWVDEIYSDLDLVVERIKAARAKGEAVSIAYQGNIVDLWQCLLEKNISVDLGSDQSSLHNPFSGGYFPQGLTFEESQSMISKNPSAFKEKVQESLRKHFQLVQQHADKGMYFFDYGNAFLLECSRAGAPARKNQADFVFPSYVQDIMGPMCFDFGFGPFRWVCTSGLDSDLQKTDKIARNVLVDLLADAPKEIQTQLKDNIQWIERAEDNNLVVGSKARILYADSVGRIEISRAINRAIGSGEISAPVVLGRDHHDVSGVDSPYRETSNIYDGSRFTADMAVQNFAGDAARGATWVALHNGGGVGWGEVMNGGFGLVLDGTSESERRLEMMLFWDVNNGIARRAWARNPNALFAIKRAMAKYPNLKVTIPEFE
jgi:urocanate hydratase